MFGHSFRIRSGVSLFVPNTLIFYDKPLSTKPEICLPVSTILVCNDVKGDIHKELVVVIEYLIDLLERQGANVRNLPDNWKEY